MANQIMAIAPYWLEDVGTWVFDDPAVGLCQEPFVSGVPEMIDYLVKDIPHARRRIPAIVLRGTLSRASEAFAPAARGVGRELVRQRRSADGRLALPGAVSLLRRGPGDVVREGGSEVGRLNAAVLTACGCLCSISCRS